MVKVILNGFHGFFLSTFSVMGKVGVNAERVTKTASDIYFLSSHIDLFQRAIGTIGIICKTTS